MLFVSTLAAAPLPKQPEVPLYYPIEVGTKRVLVNSSVDGKVVSNHESIETVTKVERKGNGYFVAVSESRSGKNLLGNNVSFTMAVSHQGITLMKILDSDLSEPRIVLQLPAKIGDSWEADGITFKVEKEEEIEVTAGKFKAIVITSQQGNAVMTSWFAPKVGCVKSVLKFFRGEITTELKSFTPGKK